jgi:hypothetical protein
MELFSEDSLLFHGNLMRLVNVLVEMGKVFFSISKIEMNLLSSNVLINKKKFGISIGVCHHLEKWIC